MTDFLIRSGVLETTNSTGPGTLDLEGAATGWNRFRTRDLADNDYVVYVRRSASGAKHQLVRGQLKLGTGAGGKDQLTVGTVIVSTDGGASPTAIDWVAGDNPCAVFMASAEDLLDWAISRYGTLPAWVKKGLYVEPGAGATARKFGWYDGTDKIEISTIDETNNRILQATAFNEGKGANIASASTTDIWTPATGNWLHVTGTTTITSFGTALQAGIERDLIFDGALTLTNGANLVCPGGRDLIVAAGDMITVRADTTTVAYITKVVRADGTQTFGWRTLESAAPAAVGSYIRDSIPSWVNFLRVTGDLFPASDGVALNMLTRKSSGTDITSYDYQYVLGNTTTASANVAGGQSAMALFSAVQNDSNVGGAFFRVDIGNIQSARYKRALVTIFTRDGTPASFLNSFGFLINDTAALTGVKLLFGAGNINDGRVLVEGCA
jgi:hypothetical protein